MSRYADIRYSSLSRDSLAPSRHATVDTVLKELKAHSRRIQTASEAFRTEFRVLERVYYKGKNQHRSALFWKRVIETRRYCERLNNVQVDELVNRVRRSFFCRDGSDEIQNMKGSWTHYPDEQTIRSVSRRLRMCSDLLLKMQSMFVQAYRSLELHIQSGAFLQLILILIAIVSRLKAISSELHINVRNTRDSLRLLETLQRPPSPNIEEKIAPMEIDEPVPVPPSSEDGSAKPSEIGSKLVREPRKVEPQRVIIERKPTKSVTATEAVSGIKKKKKKTRKDEIDDIFGTT